MGSWFLLADMAYWVTVDRVIRVIVCGKAKLRKCESVKSSCVDFPVVCYDARMGSTDI